MNETHITLQGNIGGEIRQRETAHGPVATFRVACTPGYFDRRTQTWVDGDVQWYTVSAFKTLAGHCVDSLASGDPVVVYGTLSTRAYTHEGQERLELAVKARSVGHDLALGTSRFTRMPSRQPALGEVAA